MTQTEAAPQTQALTPFQARAMELRENIAAAEPTAIVPKTFAEVQAFASAISASSLIPQALRDNAPNVLMMIMAGAEIHVPPIASLRLFHVIEGVPKLSADGIAAICTRDPSCEYLEPSEMSATSVTWIAKKRGRPEKSLKITREEMVAAGLYDRKNRDGSPGNHQKYPRQMLNARCKSEICRLVWPHICAGMISSEESADSLGLDVNQIDNAIDVTSKEWTNYAPLPVAQSSGDGDKPTPIEQDVAGSDSKQEADIANPPSAPTPIAASDVKAFRDEMICAPNARELGMIGARIAGAQLTEDQRADLLKTYKACSAKLGKATTK